MPTKYTYKKVEGDFEIFRNDEHVATYDPVTEDVTYTHGNDKYSGPIGREVVKIKQGDPPATPEPPKEVTPEPPKEVTPEPPKEVTPKVVAADQDLVAQLNSRIKALQLELAMLRDENKNDQPVVNRPSRYDGLEARPKGCPATGPYGDMDDKFVEWCRKGGVSKEHFIQRYKGRLKDLTYLG